MQTCRFVTGVVGATTGVAIKVDYVDPDGNAVTGVVLPVQNGIVHVMNVTKVYQTGTANLSSIYLHP